ncbi:nitrogenase iron-molybdenum cofactor biosynthesis protein NifN [Neiella marina]|uniref:Nitrogenase iron-molybdenum cofactor biosynthesis protein NifN n=2 Tax=Neiella holothuriorum TaxID=2870530 RepID=A0ABS7EK41_9GAMM|nr:nitrogenase iron-molybdenum cofactor biosynthesis protein NifN [Neiella holothuriorum]
MTNKRALVERPLKTSQPTGATLAMLGVANSIPLMHGSQGCAAFAKVYLIQHFREPVPLQNTAIDQVAAVMGGDENLTSAIALLCEKHAPDVIGVLTTGLTEMQGTDIDRVVAEFRQGHPQYAATRVVVMNTPDFSGSLQTGYAVTIDALVKQLVQPDIASVGGKPQLNVLASSGLTAADIDLLRRYIESFGFDAKILPDLSQSLDGHVDGGDFSPTSSGGIPVQAIESMSASVATLVIGESLLSTGQWLQQQHQVPCHFVGMTMGIAETDQLIQLLTQLSGLPVPDWISHSRKRLQDAMLDCHFLLSQSSIAMALETDLAAGYQAVVAEQGMNIRRVVTASACVSGTSWPAQDWIVGDLSDVEAVLDDVELVVGNTHCANLCEPQVPVMRAGYPCHDRFGVADVVQIGYQGARSILFGLANLMQAHHQDEVAPHYSKYRFEPSEVTPTTKVAGGQQ